MGRYGDNHKGGRPTKAEEMGLEKNMNEAFKALSTKRDITGIDGAEGILHLMWDKAADGDIKAIQWLAERYYGKEPKAIIQEVNHNHGINRGTIKEVFNAFREDE